MLTLIYRLLLHIILLIRVFNIFIYIEVIVLFIFYNISNKIQNQNSFFIKEDQAASYQFDFFLLGSEFQLFPKRNSRLNIIFPRNKTNNIMEHDSRVIVNLMA